MSLFSIKREWLRASDVAVDEATATHSRLQIFVGRRNITEHRAPRTRAETALEIPAYYLAEWIAENWWVLLFEPRKDEDADDSEYLSRHSILTAQGGFPLPNLSIVPTGRAIHLNCSPRVVPFANIKFTTDAFADVPRNEMEIVLATFVRDTVERLMSCGVRSTPLEEAWNAFEALTREEREFCELVGSLGLSPSEIGESFCEALARIHSSLGGRAMRDFCLAATRESVESSVGQIVAVSENLDREPNMTLAELLKARLPTENYNAPSWRRGYQAAKSIRDQLGVDTKDDSIANLIFERLKIDPNPVSANTTSVLPFAGAIDRRDGAAKIALLQPEPFRRRFSAVRAAYLAWVSESRSRRLVTNAVTRDQQASRSFAAEILIPQAYLKSLAGPRGELHYEQVREAARNRKVMPDVAFKQAYNAGIRIQG